MRFQGKSVIVTGGASGIGKAAVCRFHREGANVLIADFNDERGESLVAELAETTGDASSGRVIYQRTDVSNWEDVAAMVARAEAEFGRLDVLFNNAGIGVLAETPDLDNDEWQRVINVDLNSIFYGCKAAIPVMKKNGGGVIINNASASGLMGDYGHTAYNAAKGGVVNYTRAAAIDHAKDGIRINAVCPGPVATPLLAGIDAVPPLKEAWHKAVPMGRFAEPEEIAAVAAFLASEDASFMVGAIVPVDGGLTAHTGQPNLIAMFQ